MTGSDRSSAPPGVRLPPGRRVDLPGRGTTFVRELPGPPGAPVVVLLHGWTVSADLNWFACYEALGRRYRVLAIDHRGHGRGLRAPAAVPARRLRRRRRRTVRGARHPARHPGRLLDGRPHRAAHLAPPPPARRRARALRHGPVLPHRRTAGRRVLDAAGVRQRGAVHARPGATGRGRPAARTAARPRPVRALGGARRSPGAIRQPSPAPARRSAASTHDRGSGRSTSRWRWCAPPETRSCPPPARASSPPASRVRCVINIAADHAACVTGAARFVPAVLQAIAHAASSTRPDR